MAILGRWVGGVVSGNMGTSFTAPSGLFATEARNDGSAYSFSSSTASLTLPSTDLADGYLIVAQYEYEGGNNRINTLGRLVQSSGTGNFVGGTSSGYSRDNSENKSYIRCWAFIDNPSSSATIQFQWARDSNNAFIGVLASDFEVVPFYYSNAGVYSSADTTNRGSNTPDPITGWSSVFESDTNSIELSSNTVTVKGEDKRYLVLGNYYYQDASSNNRSERLGGFQFDGTLDERTYGYSYFRNNSNDRIGEMSTWILETSSADIEIDYSMYRGPVVGLFPNYGAPLDNGSTAVSAAHAWVVLELNDSAEVFRSGNSSQQSLASAGTRVQIDITPTLDFNDSNSFTSSSSDSISIQKDMDALVGANISGGYATTSTQRFTGFSAITIDGVDQDYTKSGDYARGDQGVADSWGWSANNLSAIELSTGEQLGISAGKILGGENGTISVLSGLAGWWGINLDSLKKSFNPYWASQTNVLV